ncbi:MAG: undecaprenyldiphospho-muramoylpentapeptide beta-N-acetylglucosaminyltransferase [Flavobacteriales bacterium]|nr:undecaprenyldiphospho-muramoylpentapeptide beta-N-acetylglucosaminyltransferase [Flavobacteriales bacterium]
MSLKVLISGGGTGGHIFPAIAIANTIKKTHPDAQILFVGANGKMEMEKVPAAGYEIIGLNITGIQRKLSLSNLAFPFRLIGSLIKARAIIKTFKPSVVVGVGGFASGPVLRMATWMKIPALIQEQNSFAGITNRWVASSVQRVCVAYDHMDKFFPKDVILKTGNPVRENVVQIEGKKQSALAKWNFTDAKPILLVVGGSLGARSINQALAGDIQRLIDAGMQVMWQTGKLFADEAKVLREKHKGDPVVITEFIYEMDLAYAMADMVVSRAGAIAVSELTIVGKPTILVPFPYAAEDHQTMNAMALVNTDAAIHVADKVAALELVDEVLKLNNDRTTGDRLKDNMRAHALPNAAEEIAAEVVKIARA